MYTRIPWNRPGNIIPFRFIVKSVATKPLEVKANIQSNTSSESVSKLGRGKAINVILPNESVDQKTSSGAVHYCKVSDYSTSEASLTEKPVLDRPASLKNLDKMNLSSGNSSEVDEQDIDVEDDVETDDAVSLTVC